ncbi:hypothetical protein SBBP2_2420005 [Burkholderiales bacterium]|nr:hypothetical protein SBBP2_2420005 [Burkholderiales bacterium]
MRCGHFNDRNAPRTRLSRSDYSGAEPSLPLAPAPLITWGARRRRLETGGRNRIGLHGFAVWLHGRKINALANLPHFGTGGLME